MDDYVDLLPDRAAAACELAKTIDVTKDQKSKAALRRLLNSLVELTIPEEPKKEGTLLTLVRENAE